MQNIIELAVARRAAFDFINSENTSEEEAERHAPIALATEIAILSALIATREEKLIARDILYEGGQVDFADSFKAELALKLIHAAI